MKPLVIAPPDLMNRLSEQAMPAGFESRPQRLPAPFPVEESFQVKPDLAKLGSEPLWMEDRDWPRWTAKKRQLMALGRCPIFAKGLTERDWATIQQAVIEALASPSGPINTQGGLAWLGGFEPQSAVEFFQALTLSLQEDFVVMRPGMDGHLRASLLSVAFPSGWRPEEKLGQSMFEIHTPVAENQALQRSARALSEAMQCKGPFVRYVWTLSGSGALSRDPAEDSFANISKAEQLWFRCERQITVPLFEQGSLFLIRVFVEPLHETLAVPGRRDRLMQSLASMSDAVLAYKGITRARELLLGR
jgi:dimethylamine monooxygenase subunit A